MVRSKHYVCSPDNVTNSTDSASGNKQLSGVCRMWLEVWWVNWVGVSSVFAHRFQREPSGVVEGNQGKLVCCQSAQIGRM